MNERTYQTIIYASIASLLLLSSLGIYLLIGNRPDYSSQYDMPRIETVVAPTAPPIPVIGLRR